MCPRVGGRSLFRRPDPRRIDDHFLDIVANPVCVLAQAIDGGLTALVWPEKTPAVLCLEREPDYPTATISRDGTLRSRHDSTHELPTSREASPAMKTKQQPAPVVPRSTSGNRRAAKALGVLPVQARRLSLPKHAGIQCPHSSPVQVLAARV